MIDPKLNGCSKSLLSSLTHISDVTHIPRIEMKVYSHQRRRLELFAHTRFVASSQIQQKRRAISQNGSKQQPIRCDTESDRSAIQKSDLKCPTVHFQGRYQ